MKSQITLLLLLVLLIPSLFAKNAPDQLKIEQQVQSFMAKEDIPAMAVAIVHQGKVMFSSGFGVLDRETKQQTDAKTLFQIGSQSKVLTSIITLELVKAGKLNLSDRVIELLPDAFSKASLDQFKSLTIEHLMVHRSGLPNFPANVSRVDGDPLLGGYNEDMLLTALKTIELEFRPDEKWRYSNFNYAVLGYVLKKITNESYAQLIKEYIADKYDLSDTSVNLTDNQKEIKLATPYRKDNRQVATQPWDMGLLAPHGGVYSNIDDLAHLMELQLTAYSEYRNSGVPSPLISTQVKYDTNFSQGGETYPGLSYGLGMFEAAKEFPMFSETVLFHGGDLDGFGSEYRFSAEHGVGVVLLTSSGGREFVRFAMKIMDELLESVIDNPKSQATPSD